MFLLEVVWICIKFYCLVVFFSFSFFCFVLGTYRMLLENESSPTLIIFQRRQNDKKKPKLFFNAKRKKEKKKGKRRTLSLEKKKKTLKYKVPMTCMTQGNTKLESSAITSSQPQRVLEGVLSIVMSKTKSKTMK